MSSKKKKELSQYLTKKIKKTIEKRKNDLAKMSGKVKELGEVILKLLDPDPKKRYAPHKARELLDSVLVTVKA